MPLAPTKRTTICHLKAWTNKTTVYDVGNIGSDLGKTQICGGVKRMIVTPFDDCISNYNTDINKQTNNLHVFAFFLKQHRNRKYNSRISEWSYLIEMIRS